MHSGRCRKTLYNEREILEMIPLHTSERRKESLKFHWIAFRVFAR
jgi:hypothetical protein